MDRIEGASGEYRFQAGTVDARVLLDPPSKDRLEAVRLEPMGANRSNSLMCPNC
jgi:hypothetical protein